MATLLYHWKLDEGTGQYAYSSATANTGTLYDTTAGDRGVAWAADGYNGAGLSCDNTAGNDEGASTAVLLTTPPSDFTVCAWFKTSDKTTYPMVSCVPTNNPLLGMAIWLEQDGSVGRINAGMYTTYSGGSRQNDASAIGVEYADNTWHHAAFGIRASDNRFSVFADCTEKATTRVITPISDTAKWRLGGGRYFTPGSGAFNGTVDDIRVYDGYLTAAEVCAVMEDFEPPPVANALMFSCNT
jgi:hypothetical protein